MATDQQFIKKENKNLNVFEKIMQWFVPLAAIAIGVIAYLYLFMFKQECGTIDKEFVWCYVHPISIWGVIGLILFYQGLLWISSITPRLLIFFGVVDDDSSSLKKAQIFAFVCLLGFFLIYV